MPTTSTPALARTARNLSDQLPKLQKELDTPISFIYHSQTIRPAKADRSQWFVPVGASMAPQPAAAERYIAKLARQVGITMLGRASGKHYLAFAGKQRLVRVSPQPTELA